MNSSEPTHHLVSICMPAHNVGKTIGEAIQSVLAQTHQNFEIVLVDDGSTDDTPLVVQSISDHRIRYHRNETTLGGYQTMNNAMRLARGNLIALYHTDDVYQPDIVANEVRFLQTFPEAGAVFCLDHYMDEQGRIYGGTAMPLEFQGRDLLRYEDVFPFLLRNKNILLRCPTFMTRRSILATVGFFQAEKYHVAADLDLWIRIVRQFPIGVLNERLMKYRHAKSQWSNRYNRLRTEEEVFFSIMDFHLNRDGWKNRLTSRDATEYAFHRCDDQTFRAANHVITGNIEAAKSLLRQPYPLRTLLVNNRQRRKLRVLLLRVLLRCGLAIGAVRPLSRILIQTEYGGRI